MEGNNNIKYTVIGVLQETVDVVTLKISSKEKVNYRAGQFITVFFPETGHIEGKSYSLSSSPHEEYMSISVKAIGVFSKMLQTKKVGDTILASHPYGYFYSESETGSMVIITAGIGVAPCRSMIIDFLYKDSDRKIVLYYANKTIASVVFKQELDSLTRIYGDRFVIKYYITQEEVSGDFCKGRIPLENINEETRHLRNREFFVCGSISFVRDYWRGLRGKGVPEENIYTEAFF